MLAALTATLLAAALAPGTQLTVDPGASALHFHIVHKFHRVTGTATGLEGKAVVRPDGAVQTEVRAPVTSFRTGDANRDEHMMEVLEPGKFPWVTFKGVAHLGPGGALPSGPVEMTGQVDLHGVTTPVKVPLTVEQASDGTLHARGGFEVSLDAHHVERPSLLFVKIEDGCTIDVDLALRGATP